jgi:putative membrane protein
MMWYWSGGMHWWGWLLGFAGMVVFWGLIIYAGWWVFTNLARTSHPAEGSSSAKHLLDERLARGEIDAEGYRRLRDLITGADHRPAGNGFVETPPVHPR